MPKIENVAAADIPTGHFHHPGPRAVLIQIMDPGGWWPEPYYNFMEIHRFEFLDVEEEDEVLEPEMKITDEQAQQLVALLKHALKNDMDVVVHCFAGVCRSGAVCEVGVMLGFQDPETYREPNKLVLKKMLQVLGH